MDLVRKEVYEAPRIEDAFVVKNLSIVICATGTAEDGLDESEGGEFGSVFTRDL